MSREIKFRAFNGGKMNYLDGFIGSTLRYFIEMWSRDAPVEQYSGIKDKKNVDVYEGDIIDIKSSIKESERSFVKFANGSFRLGDGCSLLGGYLPHEIEVIGNIHENPELLELE